MNMSGVKEQVGSFFVNLGMVILGGLCFVAAFPNPLIKQGVPLLGWLAYIPLYWVVNRSKFLPSVLWGAFYWFFAYSLFNYWLSAFHPVASIIVNSLVVVYMSIVTAATRFSLVVFPKRGYILQCLCWVVFQYSHTRGFLSYPYGILGYSQWQVPPVLQLASITGVWGVSALMIFPQLYIAAALKDWFPGKGISLWGTIKRFLSGERIAGGLYAVVFAAVLVYGFLSPVDYAGAPTVRIALVQHNTDPWKPSKAPTPKQSLVEYQKDLRILRRLSSEALAAEPKPDMVVWSETAFVPRIYWHTTYRDDPESYILIRELMDYLKNQDVPFVIGNDDARLEMNENGNYDQVDYNAVFLYERDELKQLYRKIILVPFTEYFPYKKQLPWVYEILENADTHFWKKGIETTVFETSTGLKFSTPICFEDSFGYLSRDFVRNGAEILVNLTNDAWSKSLSAQYQHLAMAVFRAVENRRSMVRSTASGQTCGIDPNGRILAMAEPFTEAQLTVTVPLVKNKTFYTEHGDYVPQFSFVAVLLLLLGGVGRGIIKKVHNTRKKA
ncbi:MAG: apolipoprotein N-acyltransferase [Treponema sp.]|jgi:apolipoprotein N-acyltransferase|nr:apolipoprotein N-acyltransferase [Treponema sp.]